MEYDLKKLEEKFHEFLRTGLDDEHFDIEGVKLTESLFLQGKVFLIPFGFIRYFLAVEDEKPVLFVNIVTRMDIDSICIIDEDSYACYDVFFGDHKEIIESYHAHSRNLEKRFKNPRNILKIRKQKGEK